MRSLSGALRARASILGSRKASRTARLLGCVLLVASVSGCWGTAATTRIERGETVSTGQEAFDSFFREVSDARAEADKTGSAADAAAKPLKDALGSANSSTPPPEVLRAEAKKLQTDGTLLHFELLPEAKVIASEKPPAESQKLLDAAEKSANEAVTVARKAGEILVRIADLERRRIELVDKAKVTFKDEKKQQDVSLELVAAASVLEKARLAAQDHGGAAARLALDLAMALETGASVETTKKPKKPVWKPTGPPRPKKDDFDH